MGSRLKAGRAEGVKALGRGGLAGGAVEEDEEIEDLATDLPIAPGPGLRLRLLFSLFVFEDPEGVKGCSRNMGDIIGTAPRI